MLKIEGPKFSFSLASNASVEERAEAAHVICRILVDPPRPHDELRRVAIRTALAQYQGAPSARAKQLARNYATYLSNGWLRECGLETLPDPRSTGRTLLHRLARLNEGASLGWRQILRVAGPL
jgi:hypothetical protein